MSDPVVAAEPFKFYTRLVLAELTGIRATDLRQLAAAIERTPEACVYHHTHRYLQQHQYLSPEPPNDFAYWVTTVLGEKELGEELASIDTVQFCAIADLREKLVATIESYLEKKGRSAERFADPEEAFHFIKSVSFVFPTRYAAQDLPTFVDALENVAVDSLYFHIFEARLRLGKKTNDFSLWLRDSLGEEKLADEISALDPYTYTLDELRLKVIALVERRIKRKQR